jgi:uncharacterized iron-regulated membrane protein
MMILLNAVRLHKWLALLIGLQVFLWLLGGLVMSALPIEKVRSEHNIAEHAPLAVDPSSLIPVSQAARAAGLERVDEAMLTALTGAPVWRLQSADRTVVISADTGQVLTPVDEVLARAIAEHDFAPDVGIESARLLAEPPTEYAPGGPVWQIIFADDGHTRLYIDPESGLVRARRSDTWRLFDFFWKLHVMDYDDGADFNHPLLIGAAFLGVLVSLAGLVILFFRMRRSLMVWRSQRGR